MLQMATFTRDGPLPSYFANALAKVLSLLACQFRVLKVDATHVQVPASANGGAAVIAVQGEWRWAEATVGPVAHPGGGAGIYPAYVTAAANNIQSTPAPFTDDTNYAFGLQVLAPGVTPTIVAGAVDIFTHVADVHWDGAQITRIDQLVPVSPLHAGSHAVGGVDPLLPGDIGGLAIADPSTAQPGDLILSAAAARAGAVLCNGAAYPRAGGAYTALFAAIGTAYGAGDGSTTFNVPDYRGRTIMGAGTGTAADATAHGIGQVGGSETYRLHAAESGTNGNGATGDNVGDHTHSVINPAGSVGLLDIAVGGGPQQVVTAVNPQGGLQTSAQSGPHHHVLAARDADTAHPNLQPYATANVFIKL